MSKTIEQQVEEFTENYFVGSGAIAYVGYNGDQIDEWLTKALQERDRIAYERGHADALRTIPVYETENITSDK